MSDTARICCCPTCSRRRRRSTSPSTRRCGCSTASCSSPCSTGTCTAPPARPADGDRYIVASGATGAWAGWDLNVAYWVDGAWMRLVPRPGWQAWVVDEASFLAWDGTRLERRRRCRPSSPTRCSSSRTTPIRPGGRCSTSRRSPPALTRSFALPDVSTELAGLSGAQTFDGDKTFAGELDGQRARSRRSAPRPGPRPTASAPARRRPAPPRR